MSVWQHVLQPSLIDCGGDKYAVGSWLWIVILPPVLNLWDPKVRSQRYELLEFGKNGSKRGTWYPSMYCFRLVPVSTTGSHQTRASVEDTGLAYTSVGGSVGTEKSKLGES